MLEWGCTTPSCQPPQALEEEVLVCDPPKRRYGTLALSRWFWWQGLLLARSGTQPPVVTGDDNHSQPAQLRSILGRHEDSSPPGRARPKAVGRRVDLAKNGLPVATSLAVAGLLSTRLDQQGGCQSPHRGIKSDSRGHSAAAKWCCTCTKGALPSVHP